jgi:hypothetical protein
MLISEKQIQILKELSKYKYLTATQMVDLGISSSIITVRWCIRTLKKNELINQTSYGGIIQKNGKSQSVKFENLNFLDKNGVKFLQEANFDNIKHPKDYKLKFSNDYLHRVLIVSTCINFEKWRKEKDIKGRFLVDFHNSETTIKVDDKLTVKPDIIINFNQNFAIIEIWAGLEKEYILSQLSKLSKAPAIKKVSEFLEYDRIPRILNIFKDSGVMERVKQELRTDPYFENQLKIGLFCFATIEQIKLNFNFWQDINGKRIDIETL